MRLGERLAAAIKRLTGRSEAKAAALPPTGEGKASKKLPEGTAKRPTASSAAIPKGSAGQSAAPGPRAKKTAAPPSSGETAPKGAAAFPKGSAKNASASAAKMPEGSAKRPAAASAAPKGTAEAVPGRIRTAQAKGSVQTVPEKLKTAAPGGSLRSAPKSGGPRLPESGGGRFSVLAEEVILTGPPADEARQLSELLRVQRRMNPGAETYGEEVL